MNSNETRLTLSIVRLIMPGGISFNLYQKLTFRKVLNLSRNMSKGYQPPNIYLISKDILDIIHDQKIVRNLCLMKKSDRYFGFLFLGDDDTISIITLLNILSSGGKPYIICISTCLLLELPSIL